MAVCLQDFSTDLIVGTPFFICTSMVAAKLGVPYVTISPGAFINSPFCSLEKAHVQDSFATRVLRSKLLGIDTILIKSPCGFLPVLHIPTASLPMQTI